MRFIFFLIDIPTGKVYYRDQTGTVLLLPIAAGSTPININSPASWAETELGFAVNESKGALYRSYSAPQDFVRDAKLMIEEIVLNGVFTEENLGLAVFIENLTANFGDPTYKLYYKGALDLPNLTVKLLDSLQVNAKEGGLGQLLESYESTPVEIPCDGSIPENIKVNLDGLKVEDTFLYEVVPIPTTNTKFVAHVPLVYITNEKDNFGVVKNSPQYIADSAGFTQSIGAHPENYIIYSNQTIKYNVKGKIKLRTANVTPPIRVFLGTDKMTTPQFIKLGEINGQNEVKLMPFNKYITMVPGEKMYLFITADPDANANHSEIEIISGDLTIKFSSQYPATRSWGVSLLDAWRLALKEVCQIASKNGVTYNYEIDSRLLSNSLNHFITSGDALRASGDINYDKFYFLNAQNSLFYGPIIKTTIADLIKHTQLVLFADIGTIYTQTGEKLSIESKAETFDSSVVDLDIGEVSNLVWKPHPKHRASDIKIGWAPQTYDQKAGKYEVNTTLSMKLPVNKINQEWNKISPYRADIYGIERLRSTISEKTSTTRNDSDNSVFTINIDRRKPFYDYQRSTFISLVQTGDNQTNQTLIAGDKNVGIDLSDHDGTYFVPQKDRAIFVFSQQGYSQNFNTNIQVEGVANISNFIPGGPPAEVTLTLWRNGVAVWHNTVPVTGINTPISINTTINQTWAYDNCLYFTVETTPNCEANINTVDISLGTSIILSGFNIPVGSGEKKYLSFENVTDPGSNVIRYDYDYFYFNTLLTNPTFKLNFGVNTEVTGNGTLTFNIWINGVKQAQQVFVSSTGSVTFAGSLGSNLIQRSYQIGDIIFFTASSTAVSMKLFTATATWESTNILVYLLRRANYTYLSGIPNLAIDSGVVSTTVAGAPYNLEDFTPKSLYKLWGPYWKSMFLDQVLGPATFQGLSKNPFLSKTVNGVTITENADEPITGTRLFWPIQITGEFKVPLTFMEKLSGAKKAHVKATYFGEDIYFFVEDMREKPAFNESTKFIGVLSPRTDITKLINVTGFKLPDMKPNSIFSNVYSPIQWVPINEPTLGQYTTRNRNLFLFKEQVSKWIEKKIYRQPVAIGDQLSLPFITHSLDPIFYEVRRCDGSVYIQKTNLTTNPSPSIVAPLVNWVHYIDTSSWDAGTYYMIISNTTLGDLLISEPLDVRPLEAFGGKTVLIDGKNSFNTQRFVFNGTIGLTLSMRVWGGMDHSFIPKFTGKDYTDQMHDNTMLGGVVYEEGQLYFGGPNGCPDYVPKKVLSMLIMDQTKIEGEGMKVLSGADFEVVKVEGAPMKIWKIGIEPTQNVEGINVGGDFSDTDKAMIALINPDVLGPNILNESGSADGHIIEVNVQ